MITLYDNPFSPFARKVRMVLDHKGLEFQSIDALAKLEHEKLLAANVRGEVPVLIDDRVRVVNSSDIVAYLEDRYPDPPVFPSDPALRASARSWERCADTVLDAIVHDISIWVWPTHQRKDAPPPGLVEEGRCDLATLLKRLENALGADGYVCGALSVADFALFPHLSSLLALGVGIDPAEHPKAHGWSGRMRSLLAVRKDLEYVKHAAVEKFAPGKSPYESEKIVWRGDRIEWLFHKGFHEWWIQELKEGRVVIPSPV